MKIQSVAILGAGAVGCYVLWGLAAKAAANTLQLGVVAEGSRAERRRQNGCTINGQVYHPQVWTPQQAHGVDLLIVALKYGALPGALDSIRTIVSEHTVVMSLMNGVDSEELIAAQVGAAHVLPALIKVASRRTEDGVRFDPETTIGIIYGELTAPFDSDRVQAVRALFADTGIHFRVTEHIREEIWSKFRLNVCNNLPQAILGAGVGCYSDSAHIKVISDGLRRELEARRTPEAERVNVAAEILGAEIDRYRAGGTYAGEFPERWLPAGLAIVDEAFTEQNGLVNSTMKVVRGKVEEHFRNRLDYLYSAEGRSLKNPENLASLKKIVG